MPSVFLSHSREDLPLIEQLEAYLKASSDDISIWRDQEKIYGGQKWPKVLGEAIADQDVFLLAWSKNSSASDFVEFEWCTAIALKKTIVPCILDDTALAPSLRTFHGYPLDDVTGLIKSLQAAPQADMERREPVIRKLNEITATDETVVLAQAKSVFAQQQWTVQGNVYQAGGDIHIHVEPSVERTSEEAKPLIGRWQTRIALIVGTLTALSLVADLPGKLGIHIFSNTELSEGAGQDRILDQDLAGQVVDADTPNLEPLADVQISLLGFARKTTTDQNGLFRFEKVRAAKQKQIKFTLRKECYEVETYEATLGNTDLTSLPEQVWSLQMMRALLLLLMMLYPMVGPNGVSAGQSEQLWLRGQIFQKESGSGTKLVAGAAVWIVGVGNIYTTGSDGEYRLFVPDVFQFGQTIRLHVKKRGWGIDQPRGGEFDLPKALVKDLFLLPVNSDEFLSDEQIDELLKNLLKNVAAQVQSGAKSEEIDPTKLVQEYASEHGIDYAEVRSKVEHRIRQYEAQRMILICDAWRLSIEMTAVKQRSFVWRIRKGPRVRKLMKKDGTLNGFPKRA